MGSSTNAEMSSLYNLKSDTGAVSRNPALLGPSLFPKNVLLSSALLLLCTSQVRPWGWTSLPPPLSAGLLSLSPLPWRAQSVLLHVPCTGVFLCSYHPAWWVLAFHLSHRTVNPYRIRIVVYLFWGHQAKEPEMIFMERLTEWLSKHYECIDQLGILPISFFFLGIILNPSTWRTQSSSEPPWIRMAWCRTGGEACPSQYPSGLF